MAIFWLTLTMASSSSWPTRNRTVAMLMPFWEVE